MCIRDSSNMTQPWSWRKICKYTLCFGYCRTDMQHRLPIIDRRWIWQPRKNFVQSRPCGLTFIRIFVHNVLCWVLSMRRCGMNGIKGYISIREASYRWGVSERRGHKNFFLFHICRGPTKGEGCVLGWPGAIITKQNTDGRQPRIK